MDVAALVIGLPGSVGDATGVLIEIVAVGTGAAGDRINFNPNQRGRIGGYGRIRLHPPELILQQSGEALTITACTGSDLLLYFPQECMQIKIVYCGGFRQCMEAAERAANAGHRVSDKNVGGLRMISQKHVYRDIRVDGVVAAHKA